MRLCDTVILIGDSRIVNTKLRMFTLAAGLLLMASTTLSAKEISFSTQDGDVVYADVYGAGAKCVLYLRMAPASIKPAGRIRLANRPSRLSGGGHRFPR